MNSKAGTNTKKLLFFSIVILMLFLVPNVLASININAYSYNTNFYASVPEEINVCSCGSTSGIIMIKNTGTYVSRFYLESDNEILVLPGNQYEIKPNQEYSIPFTISTNCDFTNDEITLIISNSFNKFQEFNINVQGLKCQNLASVLTYDKEVVNPCESVHFKLQVENTGSFADSYYYDFGKFDKYARHDYKTVKLFPRQVGNFNVELTLPCEMTGNFSIPTNVHTVGSGYTINYESNISVNNYYDYTMSLDNELFVCAEDDSNLSLKLTNNNNFSNTFYIKNLYPSFVELQQDVVTLDAGETADIAFDVFGSEKLIGNHDIAFKVTSMYGNIVKELNSTIYLANCYDISIDSTTDSYSGCGRMLDNIYFTVKNNGEVSQNINLELPYWTATFPIDNSSFELESGQEKIIKIDVSNVLDKDALYNIPINAYISGKDVKFTKELSLDVTGSWNCDRAIIEPSNIKINYDATNKSFVIKNIGSNSLWYNISIDPYNMTKSSWIHTLKDKIINLNPNEEYEFIVNFDQDIYFQEQGNYLFNIKVDPMYTFDDLVYNYELKITLKDKPFIYYAGMWIVSNPVLVFIIIIILLLIALLLYLFISRPRNLEDQNKRKKRAKKIFLAWLILAIVALILLLIFCPFKPLYPKLDNNPNDLNITMYSGDYYKIDLNNYFVDPDEDVLKYYVEVKSIGNNSLEGYQITFEDSLAIIHPFDNVKGVLPLWFYATDSREVVKSDMFLVKVMEKPEYTFMGVINYYLCYVAWFIIIVFLLIFVLATLSWANRKTVRQHKNAKAKNNK